MKWGSQIKESKWKPTGSTQGSLAGRVCVCQKLISGSGAFGLPFNHPKKDIHADTDANAHGHAHARTRTHTRPHPARAQKLIHEACIFCCRPGIWGSSAAPPCSRYLLPQPGTGQWPPGGLKRFCRSYVNVCWEVI